jgi:small subunit ribosomal protein S6
MENELKEYELTCILNPYLEGSDLDSFKAELERIISTNKGKVVHFMEPEKRELAYPINKQKEGIYLETHIEIEPEAVINFSKELKSNKNVLRYLLNLLEGPEPELVKPAPKTLRPRRIIVPKPKEGKPEEKMNLEEIDKKLDELIGE